MMVKEQLKVIREEVAFGPWAYPWRLASGKVLGLADQFSLAGLHLSDCKLFIARNKWKYYVSTTIFFTWSGFLGDSNIYSRWWGILDMPSITLWHSCIPEAQQLHRQVISDFADIFCEVIQYMRSTEGFFRIVSSALCSKMVQWDWLMSLRKQ